MDITTLFRACIKTVKTRNKALGLGDRDKTIPSSGILRSSKPKSEFTTKAKDIIITITKMRDFLLEHRKDYINADHLLYCSSGMTDSERDKIDSDVQAFMQMCIDVIRGLSNQVKKCPESQLKEHQEAVVALIDSYLKAVCKIYSGQKAIRVKRAVDKQKMLRLENDTRQRKSISENESLQTAESDKHPARKSSVVADGSTEDEPMDFSLSPEELQMFEEENQRLYEEMNTLVDEVREIEGKVVEIGRLQEILSEKVLQQDQDISKISDVVIGTTENVKEGNEDIREAIRKKAGFRVWILFFLLVLSFSLLFLDWYSP